MDNKNLDVNNIYSNKSNKKVPLRETPFKNIIPIKTAFLIVFMSTIVVAFNSNANASPSNDGLFILDVEPCCSTDDSIALVVVDLFSQQRRGFTDELKSESVISLSPSTLVADSLNGLGQKNDLYVIISDIDFVSSTDDAFLLQLLYWYAWQGRCIPGGIIVDRMDSVLSIPRFAATVDVWNTYYRQHIPIGIERNGIEYNNVKRFIKFDSILNLSDSMGQPLFDRTLTDEKLCNLPDSWQLYHEILSAAPDHSVRIVVTGFLSSLAQLLRSDGGIELVREKVDCVYIMGTALGFGAKKLGYNMDNDIASTKTFFELWPSDVDCVFSPGNVGELIYLDSLQIVTFINDSVTQGKHPMKMAYQCRPNDSHQFMWDALPMINAVEGDGFFSMSARGTVVLDSVVNNDGTSNYYCVFRPEITGNFRYQLPPDETIVDEWREAVIRRIKKSLYVPQDKTN